MQDKDQQIEPKSEVTSIIYRPTTIREDSCLFWNHGSHNVCSDNSKSIKQFPDLKLANQLGNSSKARMCDRKASKWNACIDLPLPHLTPLPRNQNFALDLATTLHAPSDYVVFARFAYRQPMPSLLRPVALNQLRPTSPNVLYLSYQRHTVALIQITAQSKNMTCATIKLPTANLQLP